MENQNQIFKYNGNPITFQIGENTMVNATEMAKPFGKRVRQWFDNESTHEFVETLATIRKISPIAEKRTSLNTRNLAERYPMFLKVFQGGMAKNNIQGTWMHEDLAIEFARWLSPDFAIWCNDRLKELLKYGFTATDQTLDRLIAQPELGVELFTALKEEREKHAAELKNEQECSKLQWKMCVDQAKYIQELRESALIQKISERRYLFVAIEQQRLLKQNNIPIPTNLKISRRVYERDLKRLKM